jgi:hypothetical protein
MIAGLVVSFGGLLGLGAIACSAADHEGGGESNITSGDGGAKDAAADTPTVAMQKRLSGAWLPVDSGSSEAAIVLANSGAFMRVTRDVAHKPVSDIDKQEVNRTTLTGTVVKLEGDSAGQIEMTAGLFVDGRSLRRIEEYSFALKTEDGKETLTLTELSERVVDAFTAKDAGTASVDAGPVTLRPAVQLTRAASWCARARSAVPADGDCNSQFQSGIFKPSDMPASCLGHEDLCMKCESHECKVHEVSSCELAFNSCFASIEACEFDHGTPAGQVATIDTEGHPIDCNKSPSGNAVCCQNLNGGRGD